MPRYQMTGRDGKVYTIEGPEGLSREVVQSEILKRAPEAAGETSVIRDVGGALVRGTGQLVSLPGQLTGLVTGDMDNISTRAGKAVEEFGEDLQTVAFRERQRQQAERVAEAGKEGQLAAFGQQAKELLTDPLSLAAGVAQTVPAMIGTGGAGLAGRALAGRLIGQQVAKRGALAGAATGEAAIVGGDAAQATYDRVMQMPASAVAQSTAYREAIAAGSTPEEARNAAAISAARRSAAIAAPIAAATGPLGLEAALLTGGLRRGVVRGGAEGAIREGGTELVQETGQGVAENVGAQAIDPNVELTEGLGGRAAAGLILGGTMGGGAGAISGLRGPEAEPEAEPGTEPPPPPPPPTGEAEPEPGVPATPFGAPPVSEPPPATSALVDTDADETVIIEDDQVIIVSPDGETRIVSRGEWEASQAPAAPPVSSSAPTSTPEATTVPAPTPTLAPAPAPAPTPTLAPAVESIAAPEQMPIDEDVGPYLQEYSKFRTAKQILEIEDNARTIAAERGASSVSRKDIFEAAMAFDDALFKESSPAPARARVPAPAAAPAPVAAPAPPPVTEQTLRDAGFTNGEIASWRSGQGSKDYAEKAGRGFIYYRGDFTPATPENVAEITGRIEADIARNAKTRDRIIATDKGEKTVIIGDGRNQFLAEHLKDLETSDGKLKGQIDSLNRQLERARKYSAPAPVAAPEPAPAPAPAPSPDNTEKRSQVGVVTFDQKSGIGQVPYNQNVDYRGFTAMMRPSKFLELGADLEAPLQSSLDYLTKEISSGKPVGSPFLIVDFETGKVSGHDGRHRMTVIRDLNNDQPVPVHFFGKGEQRARSLDADKIRSFAASLTSENGRPSANNFSEAFLRGATVGTAPAAPAVAPAPTLAKPPRARKPPAPPKAANTMQAFIAQIAKTFKKGQDRYSFESAVDAGVDPDWLNSRADLRRMFGKEKLTRGRDGKVIQNQRQINENLKSFSDLAMGFQPKDWGLYGESLDENGYVLPEALADLINRDAPRYDPTTGRPYEQEAQEEEDYGLDETVQRVSREASDLGVDLTDADMRAIAEQIGYDGDPAQGIVDYVNEQFEEVMAEARDYSEYDAGQEEFPDGPVTNIEDSTAEPGVGGQATAPGDTGQGQADREQPAGAAPGTQEGSLGLSAVQPVPAGGMTERQRAEMQARLQQSQMRRGSQQSFDQQEGGMFDASRDQGDMLSGRAEPEEELDTEIDYDEHPLMVAHNQKFEDLIEALDELETPASVRKRVNKLIKDGVLDEGVVDDINEAMDDEDPGYKTDAGRDALVEALENARDEAVTDIEEEIDQLVAEERDRLSEVAPGDFVAGVRMDIDKYRGGKLSDMLEEIFANFDNKFSQYDMYLAGRISTILSEVERAGFKVKLNIVQQGDPAPTNVAYGAAYGAVFTNIDDNTIDVYLRSPTTGENSAGNTSEVVLHEALHAVSAALILAAKNGRTLTPKTAKFVSDLNDVYSAFVKHFNQRVKSGAKLTEFEQSIRERRTNALVNPDEFLTWGMTNANAQEYLRGIEVGPGQNLFQRFVAMFKSMLGIPDGDTSALSRLIEIVNPLFEATEADYRAIMKAPPSAKQGPAQGTLFARGAQMRGRAPPPSGPPPSGPQPSLFPSQQPPSLVLPKETRGQRYSRKLVDRFERLRVVQSLGQLAAGFEGFYEAARKFDSRAGELMAKFERDFGKKIKEIAREAGFGMNDIDLYLYSKAAPEINADFEMREIGRLVKKKGGDPALMTKVNGTNPNFDMNQRERDWHPRQPRWSHPDPAIDAAILAQYKKPNTTLLSGSGISNKDAFDEVDPLENGPKGQAWKDIAKVHRDSVKWALDNDVARGVKSRKIADEMLKAIPHYVPVKGKTKPGQFLSDADFALMDDQGDSYEEMMSGGAGFSITKNEWNQRRGRKTLPFSPYGTFVSDVGARIVRGERNRVGQKMMDFFIKNPSNEWRVFSDRNPPRDRNGNIRRPSPKDDEFMIVKRGGETFYLRINDPLLAKAAKNLNPQQMNWFLELSNKVTRLLSRSFTTANPDFFVPNVFRDLQSAALNLGADSPGLAKAFRKFVRDKKVFRTIASFEYGGKGGDPALRDLYEQFKLDGGSVSWAQRETPQEAAARIQDDLKTLDERLKDIKDAKGAKEAIDALWKPTGKGFRAMVGALESTNAIFENGIRFAAYRAAIDVGMTREQAAMVSREATVDFNRRGEAGALLNALYAFFNAGIQGSVRTARALSNNPLKTGKLSTTQAALLGMMATAATLAAANAGISDEDDDGKLFWDKIPDYEKERNLIIMSPLNGRSYLKIPMPYGFGFFPYLATRTMDAARRGDDFGAAGMDIVTAALGNFSPVQFSAGNVPSSIARAATPTVFKPLTELALNENFMGKPIYNEPFDRGQSYASVARYNTPEGYKEFSQFLNDISGGEGKVKGGMNFPAESFEYLLEFGLGGVNTLAKSLYKTGAEGDPFAAPVVRRLVGQPGKGRNVGEYYEREEKARVVNQQLKDSTGAERRALIEKFPTETSPRIQSALTSTRAAVKKLNEERKRIQNLDIDEGTKAERLEVLRERIDGEFVRFNRVYNQVEQATR